MDELIQRRADEDARFPRRSGFRQSGERTWTKKRRTGDGFTSVRANEPADVSLQWQLQGSGPTAQSRAGRGMAHETGLALQSTVAPRPDEGCTFQSSGSPGDGSAFSQVGWSPGSDSMTAFYAQGLYDLEGLGESGYSLQDVASLFALGVPQDQAYGFTGLA